MNNKFFLYSWIVRNTGALSFFGQDMLHTKRDIAAINILFTFGNSETNGELLNIGAFELNPHCFFF